MGPGCSERRMKASSVGKGLTRSHIPRPPGEHTRVMSRQQGKPSATHSDFWGPWTTKACFITFHTCAGLEMNPEPPHSRPALSLACFLLVKTQECVS